MPPPSISEKWSFFVSETVTPLTTVAASLDATVSQLTRSAPLYGKHPWKHGAFPKRLGATLGDDISQNFFTDFLLASAFHEDTRYYRKGPSKGIWPRIGYAISRALITRTDAGSTTFNFATVGGCAMSAGLSNAYYPLGEQDGFRLVDELGNQRCRRRINQSSSGVRSRRQPLVQAPLLAPLSTLSAVSAPNTGSDGSVSNPISFSTDA